MTRDVHLGPFRLDEEVGSGGMGAIWRATHRQTGQPVAIKVLTADWNRQAGNLNAFRREVRALAKLNHAAIAAIADYGTIRSDAESAAADEFAAGTPWYAMELVDGVDLGEIVGGWDWSQLESAILGILDGLAHAHARGVVHRDLKMSNIMVDLSDDEPSVKLVDFGIAAMRERNRTDENTESDDTNVTGTPRYMAPEQIRGNRRDQGPWTDLYALGCLIWRVVCFDAPFEGPTVTEILRRHLEGERGDFEPNIPVPPDLEGWLDGLLRRQPTERTRRAADAAWGLLELGDPVDEAAKRNKIRRFESYAPTLSSLIDTAPTLSDGDTVVDPPTFTDGPTNETDLPAAPDIARPPIPVHWRHGNIRKASPLPSAGLQLFAMRDVPMVDRDAIRHQLWESLRQIDADGKPRTFLLDAPAGRGKSQIAKWLAHRAHELGAARILKALHTPQGGRRVGLAGMFRSALRGQGLDRSEFHERLRQRRPPLHPDDPLGEPSMAKQLTELAYPTSNQSDDIPGPQFQFASPSHRRTTTIKVFETLCRARPLIVWLDDLQWGDEALAVLEHIWEHDNDELPVLFVATLQSNAMSAQPALAQRLRTLADQPRVERTSVEPMDRADHRLLVESLLDLEPNLVDELVDRTEGNPLFVRQLLGHWVDSGQLEPGPEGFRVTDSDRTDLPDDIDELWLERIDRLLQDLPARRANDTLQALELAAALGREVSDIEWQSAIDTAGLNPPDDLLDRLIERGLAERADSGWAFAHGLLVDSLEERARDGGRWEEHHRVCARVLAQNPTEPLTDNAARCADHWLEAGETERALEPLSRQQYQLARPGDHARRRQVLQRRRELLDQLDIPADDRRRVKNDIGMAHCDRVTGASPEDLLDRLEQLRRRAQRCGYTQLLGETCRVKALCHRINGELDAALEYSKRALQIARELDDLSELVPALLTIGRTYKMRAEFDRSEAVYKEAVERSAEWGDRFHELLSWRSLAWLANSRGNDDRTREILRNLLPQARDAGFRGIECQCYNELGELARFAGRADEALEHYRRTEKITTAIHRIEGLAVAKHNLAMTHVMAENFAEATRCLDKCEQLCDTYELGRLTHGVRLTRLAVAASEHDWTRFDRIINSCRGGWPEHATHQRDHHWLLEMAGEHAADADKTDRARRAWRLAVELAERLDYADTADRLQERLDSLG